MPKLGCEMSCGMVEYHNSSSAETGGWVGPLYSHDTDMHVKQCTHIQYENSGVKTTVYKKSPAYWNHAFTYLCLGSLNLICKPKLALT